MALEVNPLSLAKLGEGPAPAFPMFIRETAGPSRMIVLRGRSLPYRGVSFPVSMRGKTKWYPGNPVAQQQMLGSVWDDTTLEGTWKDTYLADPGNAADLIGFPPVGAAGRANAVLSGGQSFRSGGSVPGLLGKAERARTLRDAFYMIARSGQLLRLEWGSIVRYGFLRKFTPTHDSEEDIPWSMEFEWQGDTNAAPKFTFQPNFDPPGLLAAIIAALQAFLDEVGEVLAFVNGIKQKITSKITKIGQLLTSLIQALSAMVSLALTPIELLGTLTQQLTSIVLALKDLMTTLREVPAAYIALKEGISPTGANLINQLVQAVIFNARKLAADAIAVMRALQQLKEPDVIAVVVTSGDQTLRDLALQHYGSESDWKKIADFNDIAGSIVPPGTVVRIPR